MVVRSQGAAVRHCLRGSRSRPLAWRLPDKPGGVSLILTAAWTHDANCVDGTTTTLSALCCTHLCRAGPRCGCGNSRRSSGLSSGPGGRLAPSGDSGGTFATLPSIKHQAKQRTHALSSQRVCLYSERSNQIRQTKPAARTTWADPSQVHDTRETE